jgi:DNA-binding protein H-NS
MAKSYSDLQKQIEALQAEAERIRGQEVAGVIDRIKEAIQAYGLTAADLGLASGSGKRAKPAETAKAGTASKARGRGRSATRAAAGAKFRNEQGQTWGGRGPRPRWLREALASGKSLEDFAV